LFKTNTKKEETP